jgi:FMN reductase
MSTETLVLVGNPRPLSRTRTAAEQAAGWLASRLEADGPTSTIDLADIASELFASERPAASAALERVARASLLVVATPVYKASYTGLLKAFLDLYGPAGLAGVRAVPLVVSAAPAHAAAGDDHLRPLLVELGAQVPARSVALLESQLTEVPGVLDDWWAAGGAEGLRVTEAAHA